MADIQKTIEIIFGATDNASSAIGGIADSIDGAVTKISGVTEPLSKVAEDALKAQAAIVSMGVAFLGISVNEAAKFQTSMNEIGTLFSATPDQVDALKTSVKEFAVDSVFSLDNTTTALYDMVSATGDTENAVAGLEAAQSLAVVGNTDLGTSVNALTSVLNAYGLDMTGAESVSDAFFVTIQNGKTTLPELDAAIGKVAATAAASGVSFEQVGAAVATLTGAGINTSVSMTSLQAILKEMAAPSKELTAALGGMSLETNTLGEVMVRLGESTGGGFVEMNNLFGSIDATKGAVVLANDQSGTFSTTLEAMGNKTGTVSENFKLMEENLGNVTQNMKTSLTVALTDIGDNLLPGWTDIVGSISDVFKGVDVGIESGAFDEVFTALNDFQGAIAEFFTGIGEALPEAMEGLDFSGLLESFGGLGESISGIFGDLDLTNAADLETALQFAIDSVSTLTTVVSGIVDSWGPALRTIGEMVTGFNDSGTGSEELVGFILGLSQQFETFKGAIGFVTSAMGLLVSALATLAGIKAATSITSLVTSFTGLGTSLPSLTTGISSIITKLGPAGMVLAAGAAGVALGTLAKDGIDAVIESTTGTEGATLGTWIYDLLHAAESGTTVEELGKVKTAIESMSELNLGIVEEIEDILSVTPAGDLTTDALESVKTSLVGLSEEDTTEILTEISNILSWEASDAEKADAISALTGSITTLDTTLSDNAIATDLSNILELSGSQGNSTKDAMGALEEALTGIDDVGMESIAGQLETILGSDASDDEKAKLIERLTGTLTDAGTEATTAEGGVRDFDTEVEKLAGSAEDAATDMGSFADKVNDLSTELVSTAGDVSDFTESFDATDIDGVKTAIEAAVTAGKQWSVQLKGDTKIVTTWGGGVNDGTDALTAFGGAANDTKQPVKDVVKELGKLTDSEKFVIEQTAKMETTLLDIASNEKIAHMEFEASIEMTQIQADAETLQSALQFSAEIEIASLEADARKVQAIMGAVASAYQSTAETVDALVTGFDVAFTDSDRDFFKDQIEKQLERQLALDEQLINLQKAEVEKMKAETKALNEGVEVIITAEGLEPELEAFMFKILNRIQTKISGDKASFLLGAS